MTHLQEFKVRFEMSNPRQEVKDGVVLQYFRNVFTINGKTYSTRSPLDLTGLPAIVAFVKGGELGPDGKTPINRDGFTMLGVTTLQGLTNTLQAKRLENEIKGMD